MRSATYLKKQSASSQKPGKEVPVYRDVPQRVLDSVKMCKVLEVSRSRYYKYIKRKTHQRARAAENARLLIHIKEIHIRSRKIYGVWKVHAELKSQGFKYNRKRIVRLMRENGIRSKLKRKYKVTTHSDHKRPIAENLVNQNIAAMTPNRLWCSDITYIYTLEGWLYLCCILDVFDRKIAGWAMGSRLQDTLVL